MPGLKSNLKRSYEILIINQLLTKELLEIYEQLSSEVDVIKHRNKLFDKEVLNERTMIIG